MRFLDISNNKIVLRYLENIIVTAGYKFNLEYLGIEGNQKEYRGKVAVCLCFGSKTAKDDKDYTKVTKEQLDNRSKRVNQSFDHMKFMQAKINIIKQRQREGRYILWKGDHSIKV